jgi:hypothetical protein
MKAMLEVAVIRYRCDACADTGLRELPDTPAPIFALDAVSTMTPCDCEAGFRIKPAFDSAMADIAIDLARVRAGKEPR